MHRIKRILFFLFFLTLLTVVGIFYLNTIFLPLQVKDLIIQKAEAALQRDVFIEQLAFHPGKGILLKNIRIAQNNGDPVPFMTIQETAVNVPLPDIFAFWSRRFIIPSITIKNPTVDLKYSLSGEWNFSDLFAKKTLAPTPTKPSGKLHFIVEAISIQDGQITITDAHNSETITAINTMARLDLMRNVNFDLSFLIPRHSSVVNATGRFVIPDKELTTTIQAKNADIPPLLNLLKIPLWVELRECFLKTTSLNVKFKDGELILDGDVTGSVDLTTIKTATRFDVKTDITSDHFLFKRKGPHFILKGNGLTTNSILTVGQNKVFTGNYKGTEITIDRDGDQINIIGNVFGNNTKMTFNGQDLAGDVQVENIIFQRRGVDYTLLAQGKMTMLTLKNPSLDLDSESTLAEVEIQKKNSSYKIKLVNLAATGIHSMYANKVISGDVKGHNIIVSYTNDVIQTDGEFKTSNLRLVIAKSITLLGSPTVNLTVTKNMQEANKDTALSYSGVMTLNNDSLQGVPHFEELTGLKGTIDFNNDLAETKELQTTVKGSPWNLSGKVRLSNEIFVSIIAKAAAINLDIIKDLFTKKLESTNADIKGTAENVVVKYEGPLFLKESTKMTASGTLKSTEITVATLPQKVTNINGYVEYATDALDWKELNFIYAGKQYASSGSLRDFSKPAMNTTLSGDGFAFSIEGRTNDRILTLRSWKGHYRHSPFDLSGTINFRGESPLMSLNGTIVDGKASLNAALSMASTKPSDVSLEIIDLDMEKLKNSIPMTENKNISGNLSLNTKFSGPLMNPNDWIGSGALSIKNGHILEIELLKGIWKTLFSNLLVNDYKHIAFTQATGNFKIGAGKISTKDLLIKSTSVDLSMSGWAAFNGKINFDVIADVRQAPIIISSAVQAVPTTIVSQFAKNVVGFKVTGALMQPQIKYKILPLKVLKKTTNSVFLGIQGMMEDLLQ